MCVVWKKGENDISVCLEALIEDPTVRLEKKSTV
jgi:hypothetical protein